MEVNERKRQSQIFPSKVRILLSMVFLSVFIVEEGDMADTQWKVLENVNKSSSEAKDGAIVWVWHKGSCVET